jgi:hypothetical protein
MEKMNIKNDDNDKSPTIEQRGYQPVPEKGSKPPTPPKTNSNDTK